MRPLRAAFLVSLVVLFGCARASIEDVACDDDSHCPAGSVCGNAHRCVTGAHPPHLSCSPVDGGQECVCTTGYEADGTGGCRDVDECAGAGACGAHEACTNTDGAFTCACAPFFTASGDDCVDIRECDDANGGCDPHATCHEVEGGAPTCTCNDHWTGSGIICSDVDECANPDACTENADCFDNLGDAPTCLCSTGYYADELGCSDIDECATFVDECGVGTDCRNTQGTYACDCQPGHARDPGDPRRCFDVDECGTPGTCAAHQTCVNEVGGFRCDCIEGYVTGAPGGDCVDRDECALGFDDCGPGTRCRNIDATFTCDCLEGFAPDSATTCHDINECAVVVTPCGEGATCVNRDGGYDCSCPAFSEPAPGGGCRDIDECATANGGCAVDATCTNASGAPPTCRCHDGFTGDGTTCTDIDECATENGGCSAFATCSNQAGAAPTCTCLQGFTGDGRTCRGQWTAVAAGGTHTCAIRSDGALFCWGDNSSGQLGLGNTTDSAIPRQVGAALGSFSGVAAGEGFSCARTTAGRAYCWGLNDAGQSGTGSTAATLLVPTQVGSATDWSAISAGRSHACGLRGTGTAAHLWCWGANDSAQLGLGSTASPKRSPQDVVIDLGVRAVSCGDDSTCAIGPDGNAWCWGANDSNQVGDPAFTRHDTPRRLSLTNVSSISSGARHACAIASADSGLGLFCWGTGPLGDANPGGWSSSHAVPTRIGSGAEWLAVSAGRGAFSFALDGTRVPFGWGQNLRGEAGVGSLEPTGTPVAIAQSGGWQSVSAGRAHACGIDGQGRLSCWGSNATGALALGQRGGPSTPRRIDTRTDWRLPASGANASATCALRTDDSLWCWGENTTGIASSSLVTAIQAPSPRMSGTSVGQVSVGTFHACAIARTGALTCWGFPLYDLATPGGGVARVEQLIGTASDWVSVSVGESSICGVRSGVGDGSLRCWGRNGVNSNLGNGRDGTGSETTLGVVTATAPATTGLRSVSMGPDHGCALVDAGGGLRSVSCWGANQRGTAAAGAVAVVGSPTPIGLSPASFLASGQNHQAAAGGGHVYLWGECASGQCGTTGGAWTRPTVVADVDVRSLAVGPSHTCFVRNDGTLWCWGRDTDGQLGLGRGSQVVSVPRQVGLATDWREVTAGHAHTCATRADGSMWCWGANDAGQLGDGLAWRTSPTPGSF